MTLPATPPVSTPVLDDLDDDDRPIGRILTRREVLALIGAGGAATFLAACVPGGSASQGASAAASAGATAAGSATATAIASAAIATALPACVVAPELTEGPYYVDVDLDRSDIRPNTTDNAVAEGTTLTLDWIVSQADGSACMPMEGVVVDVWHCDALGVYSGVSGNSGNFLRGFQRTDANGRASFTTIYPGWYQGRAVHIHFKIRPTSSSEFTSQLFFDDAMSTQVFAQAPYSQKGTQGMTRNTSDGIFNQSGGKLSLSVTKSGDVYSATFDIGLAS